MSNTPITKFGGTSSSVERMSTVLDTNTVEQYDLAIDGNKGQKSVRHINTVNGVTDYSSKWSGGIKSPLANNGKYYTIADADTPITLSASRVADPAIGTDTQAHIFFRSTSITNG